MIKAWREVAVPHQDVREGTFQQSEFAADLTAVRSGKASAEYRDAAPFFQRTFITQGMRQLLTSVAKRLNGAGGDPVIQLQTAFGGGKTHTMLAVYHLATRTSPLKDLAGIPALLDQAGLMDIPVSNMCVLDGTALSPGQAWKRDDTTIKTLWGELAWQLGKSSGYAFVKEADVTGTSPGKESIRALLAQTAPCVILIDELVAYIRQFPEGQQLSGGTYDSNLSFVQSLTEAVKLVPNAIMLASLPESDVEAGQRGVPVLRALEKTFGRIQALWKPVATEEAFEIVRRRLFEPITHTSAREEVCRAFSSAYVAEGAKLPSETQESRYYDRLVHAYPIHPDFFDRLYEDWSTLDGFQRTRGVLKLMAKVIYRLWKDTNSDLLIMPASLPLADGGTRNELIYHLPPGWDAVIERDIDGDRAETTELESKEPRFGAMHAARRVARTIFLGSAPSSVGSSKGIRGIDRARILLGCYQPGQTISTYSDAVNRITDRLHYLNTSGEKNQTNTRYWFDTRANLRREMEDRKARFTDSNEVRSKIAEVLKKLAAGVSLDGVHVFTKDSDVPDDEGLRLVILPPENSYTKTETRLAFEAALTYVRNNGARPRYRGNRLLFISPDQPSLVRVRDCVRTALAWNSIVEDVSEHRLNIDRLQEQQAKKELLTAEQVLPRVVRDCFKWLLVPVLPSPTEKQASIEVFPLKNDDSSFAADLEQICRENELVIWTWSPIHLRTCLRELYWKETQPAVRAMTVWDDMQRYLYLPRLRNSEVLGNAITEGAATRDFFAIAYGQNGAIFEGFRFGNASAQLDETLLLIEPTAAAAYEASITPKASSRPPLATPTSSEPTISSSQSAGLAASAPANNPAAFIGSVEVNAVAAEMRLVQIADEVIRLLLKDPNGKVRLVLEITAEFPDGISEEIKRSVLENAKTLGFKTRQWE